MLLPFARNGLLILAILCLLPLTAQATTADWQNTAQSHLDLLHHWTFDGLTDEERLEDKKNSTNLMVGMGGAVGPDDWGFDKDGFDASSRAVKTFRLLDEDDGHVGFHNPSVLLPSTLSYEVLFQPTRAAIDGGAFNYGYILNTRNSPGDGLQRGYFLTQGSSREPWNEPGTELSSNIGNTWNGTNESRMVEALTEGNWYYAAGSYEIDEVNQETTFTNYIADLTAGQTTLAVTGPTTVSGVYPTNGSPLGVGTRYDVRESFPGMIDEVALYRAVLDQSEFQSHLDDLLRSDLLADLNNDGAVSFPDLTILLANWNDNVGPELGNLVRPLDTPVEFQDLTFLLAEWTELPPGGAAQAAAAGTVPEPSSLALALVAFLGLATAYGRRRRAG